MKIEDDLYRMLVAFYKSGKVEKVLDYSNKSASSVTSKLRRRIKHGELNVKVIRDDDIIYLYNLDVPESATMYLDKQESIKAKKAASTVRNIPKPQLCWDCSKACGKCTWSRKLEPVDGWTAKKTKLRINHMYEEASDTYYISACPEFERDAVKLNGLLVNVKHDEEGMYCVINTLSGLTKVYFTEEEVKDGHIEIE